MKHLLSYLIPLLLLGIIFWGCSEQQAPTAGTDEALTPLSKEVDVVEYTFDWNLDWVPPMKTVQLVHLCSLTAWSVITSERWLHLLETFYLAHGLIITPATESLWRTQGQGRYGRSLTEIVPLQMSPRRMGFTLRPITGMNSTGWIIKIFPGTPKAIKSSSQMAQWRPTEDPINVSRVCKLCVFLSVKSWQLC